MRLPAALRSLWAKLDVVYFISSFGANVFASVSFTQTLFFVQPTWIAKDIVFVRPECCVYVCEGF